MNSSALEFLSSSSSSSSLSVGTGCTFQSRGLLQYYRGHWLFSVSMSWFTAVWIHTKQTTNLGDAWVGALDIPGRKVQPATGVRGDGRTVLLHRTPSLTAAPSALELPLCPQTHATAVPLSTALVQVHYGKTNWISYKIRSACSCLSSSLIDVQWAQWQLIYIEESY